MGVQFEYLSFTKKRNGRESKISDRQAGFPHFAEHWVYVRGQNGADLPPDRRRQYYF